MGKGTSKRMSDGEEAATPVPSQRLLGSSKRRDVRLGASSRPEGEMQNGHSRGTSA